MVRVDEDHIKKFCQSLAWVGVMCPLLDNEIELIETMLENADTPHESYAYKETWKALRKLRASIEIFRER